MKSKIAQRIMEDTPEYIKAKVKQYGKQKMEDKDGYEDIDRKEFDIGVLMQCLKYLLLIGLVWILISTSIQRWTCPKMTETELFFNIPNAFICNWKNCKE
jgi:hypothetical protein